MKADLNNPVKLLPSQSLLQIELSQQKKINTLAKLTLRKQIKKMQEKKNIYISQTAIYFL